MTLVNTYKAVLDTGNVHADAADQRTAANDNNNKDPGANPDLQRAKDLLDLHREVKLRHHHYYDAGGLNEELLRNRQDVSRVHEELELQHASGS